MFGGKKIEKKISFLGENLIRILIDWQSKINLLQETFNSVVYFKMTLAPFCSRVIPRFSILQNFHFSQFSHILLMSLNKRSAFPHDNCKLDASPDAPVFLYTFSHIAGFLGSHLMWHLNRYYESWVFLPLQTFILTAFSYSEPTGRRRDKLWD